MKRTPLLVLGFVFLGLWVTCLFYPECSSKMKIALIIELIFFMHFAMVKKNRTLPEIANIDSTTNTVQKEEEKAEADTTMAEV